MATWMMMMLLEATLRDCELERDRAGSASQEQAVGSRTSSILGRVMQ